MTYQDFAAAAKEMGCVSAEVGEQCGVLPSGLGW